MPSVDLEKKIQKETGFTLIAGLDEAGRGALAGPVTAAAVILPLDSDSTLESLSEVNDSKQLSATKRAQLFELITKKAVCYGIGFSSAEAIDEVGIISATKMAMEKALKQLNPPANYLLIDGRIRLKSPPLPQQSIIRGDSSSLSIAAASILAKVARDQYMIALDSEFSGYGFLQNKGYGTSYHLEAIAQLGPSPEHRLSFSPMRRQLL